jgi:hypothetical protein
MNTESNSTILLVVFCFSLFVCFSQMKLDMVTKYSVGKKVGMQSLKPFKY